ncbi:MAG: hypothetical protein KA248_06470 [Kiritimatiellae bacterium]|nr:hypothetical protein [Kiritimatiellia bacterium]
MARFPVGLLALVLAGTASFAQEYRHLSTVQDGNGSMSTNTVTLGGVAYTNVSAGAQPGGIQISTNGDWKNYAGFLQAVDIKRPGQDTDGDGVIDELSLDNDGDTLTDLEEIEGSSFNPATATEVNDADTDGDDVPDGHEALAETDPTDDEANLRILKITQAGGQKEVTYTARSGKNYNIRGWDGSYAYPTNVVDTDQEFGGAGAWEVRTNVYTDAVATNARHYAIEPLP